MRGSRSCIPSLQWALGKELPGGHERDEQEYRTNVECAAHSGGPGCGRPLRSISGHPVLDPENLLSGAVQER